MPQIREEVSENSRSPTKEEAIAFLRRVMGPPFRELEGQEYKDIWLLLQLMDSYKSTNNQHSWTDYYRMSGNEYQVTYWSGDSPPTIAEFLPE